MRPSSPRSSRIVSTARYSRSSSRIGPSTVSSSGRSSTSTTRRPWESVEAAPATPQAVQSDRAAPTQPDAVGHLGDGADLRVLVVVLGDEQHALLVADVDGEGHVHVPEDDDVVGGTSNRRVGLSFVLTILAFARFAW